MVLHVRERRYGTNMHSTVRPTRHPQKSMYVCFCDKKRIRADSAQVCVRPELTVIAAF